MELTLVTDKVFREMEKQKGAAGNIGYELVGGLAIITIAKYTPRTSILDADLPPEIFTCPTLIMRAIKEKELVLNKNQKVQSLRNNLKRFFECIFCL